MKRGLQSTPAHENNTLTRADAGHKLVRCAVPAAALRRRAVRLERPARPPARPALEVGHLFQLAAVALLGLAALMSAVPVKAQSVTTFVSNFGQGRDSDTFTRGVRAQTFRTGWGAKRFTLHSVDIKVESSSTIQGNAQSRFSMYLCPPNADGFPPVAPADLPTHAPCVALTPPSSFAAPATLTFTAPANTRLERGTHYILVNVATSGTPLYDATLSDGEDGDSATGWAIGNGYVWYNSHPDIRRYVHTGTRLNRYRGRIEVVPVTGPNQALRFAINGTADNGPTSSDKTVTTTEGEPYRFVTGDFPFSGLESSDRLWGVKITSLPSAGELKLGSTPVTANQIIRSGDLDTTGTRLGFTPAANAHGDSYGSFTFMVMSGETTESDGGYTMTVAVTPVNDAATGTPTISGPVLVGRSLTAATAGIADIDGLPATSSFTYQWVRVDGSDETDIAGATAGAYTLAAADQGKKVKVKVSFTDNDGTVETRTSDAYPSSGAVAMSVVNAAPTAADQTVTTNEDTAYTFSAADFNFADTDTGNTLSSVTIVTLPASDKGTLKLDTTAVTAHQSVSKADLDADKLTFTPAANANGQARFTFKVSDGTDESASASAMTVAVTAVNDAATGAPTIFGGSWVGQTVTAETSGIADIDGLPGTFTYQWVRVDGSDETDIPGATAGAYTLAAADEGKTVKVKVSFTDNGGASETVTSGAFPSSDSVAAAATQTRDVIWSATLRVHATRYTAGCNSQGSSGKCTSQLNDRDFTLAGDRYEVHRIGLSYLNAFHIKFEYGGNFSPAELRKLTLYVDGASFPINTGELGVGGHIITWENSGIPFSSWHSGKRVNLRLTAPKASTPSAPRSLVATGAHRKLDLTWSAPENDGGGGISDYEYRYSAGASVAEDTPWISAGKDLKERVTGLTNGAAYAFEVRAVNRAGKSTAITATGTPITAACAAPALDGRYQVWTGKVNVASGSDFYGYDDTNGGSLDDSSLDFGVHSYVIDGAFLQRGTNAGKLVLSFTSHLPSSLLAKLTLHVCGSEGFALADASRFGPYHYRWNNSGLDWSDVSERTLYLSIPAASCAAPALGDRRQVWTGNVKVATHPEFYGYDGTRGGSLENPNFSVGDHNNTVDGAFLQRGADAGKLILSFKNALWSRLRPRLTLHVCDSEPFALDNTTNFGPNHYRWNDNTGLDWSELRERTLYLSQPANNAATGMPTITGTASVGETLTAVTTGIADTDGLPSSFAYQWVRVDGSDETDISGATAGTYTLTDDDIGKTVKVVVSFTDDFDGEEMVTSGVFPSGSTVQQTGSGTQDVEPPTITDSPALSESGADGAWTAGETVDVTLTFSEAVTVDTTGGTPSVGLSLGGTEARRATYLRGSGTTALVFAYTLTAADGSHTSLLVPIDSLMLNGGAIRSQATSADAALGHLGAAQTGSAPVNPRDEGDPFTASFMGLPESHNGSGAFTFELRFSEAPEGLSHSTVAGGLLAVTGATVDKARRLTAGSNLAWEVTMTPSQSGDIAIRLPARACTETNAVCAGGRALDEAVSATVRGAPFTASFEGLPESHNGSGAFTFELRFSAAPEGLSHSTVAGGLLEVTGATVDKARRLSAGSNLAWEVTMTPSQSGDIAIRLPARACTETNAVCAGVRALDEAVSATVRGAPFTASFEGLPESHNGSGAFTFELRFSEAPEGLSHSTVAGGLLAVTGATVDKARRLSAGSNLAWEVTMTPSQSGNIAIRLPARACSETNAVCAGVRALDEAVSATVRGAPFTASFSTVPAEHDGSTAFDIRFHLSAEPAGLSYSTVQNGLFDVTGGRIENASRLVGGKNNGWTLRIVPSGFGDVTVRVKGTSACDTAPGVCAADGRKLAGGLTVSTAGPATLSVADATVEEGADATLEFTVTLSKARNTATTVDYATGNGTATAEADYTETSGTLTFGPLETSKTVSVPVLDDAHDEGIETLTLTLSNAQGATLDDDTAMGTISNTDPMPKGWLVRFGRTSATQVLGLLDARFDEAREPASQLTLGGLPVNLSGLGSDTQGGSDPAGGPTDPAGGSGTPLTMDNASRGMADLNNDPAAMSADPSADPDPAAGAVGAGGEATLLERLAWRLLTEGGGSVDRRQFLSGSSFDLSLSALGRETDGAAIETARVRETPGHWSLWGRGALIRFTGQDRGLSLDGDVLTGLLGLDYRRGRWLAGVGLAYNDGNGAYRAPDSGTAGTLDSTLVSVHPYLHYALTDRLSAWGTLGYGAGGLSLRPERDGAKAQDPIKTDIQMRMGALGLRGMVFANATTELALKSDLMWVRTTSDATAGLAAVDGADASRVRLLLTGRHRHALATGAALTPNVELGLRYDDGDAETGAGVELGGGLRYADPVRGLTVEATARALLAHEAGGYEEWGMGGSLQLDPGRLGRGLSLRLASGWGLTDSSADALWQQQTAAGLTQGAGQTPGGRIRAEWAYGLDVPWNHGLLTPYGSVEMAGGGGRTLALGWRFELGQSLSLSLTGERREALHSTPEHALMLQTALPW